MKKSVFVSLLLAAAAVLSAAQTTQAIPLLDDLARSTTPQVEQIQGETTNRLAERAAELEAKRLEIEQRLAQRRSQITQKLEGARAERCEEKEMTINRVLDTRVSAAQRHFDKFKAIQDKLATFVVDKQLNVENATALEVIMNDKQQSAQASIDAIETTDFDCGSADATAPGNIVMDQVALVKQSLKEYRTAIKDYAVAVKGAATAETDSTSEPTENRVETETENQEAAQ